VDEHEKKIGQVMNSIGPIQITGSGLGYKTLAESPTLCPQSSPSSLSLVLSHSMSSSLKNQIIVVGGGLSGLAAAHTVLEQGGNVLLLDKNPFFG